MVEMMVVIVVLLVAGCVNCWGYEKVICHVVKI